jgi:hypothetical protein
MSLDKCPETLPGHVAGHRAMRTAAGS